MAITDTSEKTSPIPTYLFEFFHIYIQLTPKFCFRLRKSIHLRSKSSSFRRLVFRHLALLLKASDIVVDFAFFCFHQRLEMKLAQLVLFEERLELETKSACSWSASVTSVTPKPPTDHPFHDFALDSLDLLYVPYDLRYPT